MTLIENINYFGSATGTQDFNAKCLYRKNGKSYLAHIYIDWYNKRIYEGRNNPREHKYLKGLSAALMVYAEKTNWNL